MERRYFILIIITLFLSHTTYSAGQFANGKWFRFNVAQSGIYKLTYDDIKNIGFDDPSNIRIYGQGGEQLSYWVNDPRPEGLLEIPIYMSKGADGVFGGGDYILFYLQGPLTWHYDQNFEHKIHGYSGTIQYFMSTNKPGNKLLPTVDNLSLSTNQVAATGDWYYVHENNWFNAIKSGRQWFGERYDNTEFSLDISIPNLKMDELVQITAKVLGRASKSTSTTLWVDGGIAKSASVGSVAILNTEASYGRLVSLQYNFVPKAELIQTKLSYIVTSSSDRAYVDYIKVLGRVDLKYGNQFGLFFRDSRTVGIENVTLFKINSAPTDLMIWDVSQIDAVKHIHGRVNGALYEFIDATPTLKEYVAVSPSKDYPKPNINASDKLVGFIDQQNIKAIAPQEFLIVTHPAFLEPANVLAELHRQKDDLTVAVVTTEEIYNEFSSGTRDASAIRDFIRHNYLKATNDVERLRYVLLFGDGSFNNHMDIVGNTNYIPTYQSVQSLEPIYSFVSDDFYALLGEYEGEMSGDLDVGVGRLTVRSDGGRELEAWGVVNKIQQYYDASTMGDWRLRLCFLADDTEANWEKAFSRDSDYILNKIDEQASFFAMDKLYLDAFDQVITSSGASYPDARDAMMRAIEKGVLIFNYMGHGNENGATEEKVLQIADMQAMRNGPLYPLFVTATCKLGPFDWVDMVSKETINPFLTTSEAALINPDGGAIALFTTTRLVFQSNNFDLTRNLYSYLFSRDENGNQLRLGDVIRLAKNKTNDNNMRNFSLLGDPAIRLAVPQLTSVIDSVNGRAVNEMPDTVGAFDEVQIAGHVEDGAGNFLSDFNGIATILVYDKENQIVTDYHDFNKYDSLRFNIRNNVIFKGQSSIVDGRFTGKFRIPKDISYRKGYGKIVTYISNGYIDGAGSTEQIVIGGTSPTGIDDNLGPEIKLYLNTNTFKEGGIASVDPVLYAEVFDESGINTTGAGIGHDIVAYIDGDQNNLFVLNDYYTGALNDYRSGSISYPINNLEAGEHTLTLKVWDINNNSSTASISFVVAASNDLITDNLRNYPNPFSDYTTIQYEHNSPGEHQVLFTVFDLSGRIIAENQYNNFESGFISEPIVWDGTSTRGTKIAAGLYPYRLVISTKDGKRTIIHQKLIIINR